MDALIRLDVLMPIASSVENNNRADDGLSSAAALNSIVGNGRSIDNKLEGDIVDLTNSPNESSTKKLLLVNAGDESDTSPLYSPVISESSNGDGEIYVPLPFPVIGIDEESSFPEQSERSGQSTKLSPSKPILKGTSSSNNESNDSPFRIVNLGKESGFMEQTKSCDTDKNHLASKEIGQSFQISNDDKTDTCLPLALATITGMEKEVGCKWWLRQSANKHKLHSENTFDGSPSKIARTVSRDQNVALLNPESSAHSNTIELRLGSTETSVSSYLMRNHTVTSTDIQSHDLKSKTFFQPGTSFSSYKCESVTEKDCITTKPEPLLNIKCKIYEPNNNGVAPKSFVPTQNTFSTNVGLYVDQKGQFQNNLKPKDSAPFEPEEKEPEVFYQLLDIFPDIDLEFLKSQCRMGLDINQISEIILEMNNNYPKVKKMQYIDTENPVMVNFNINNTFNITTNSDTINKPIVLEEEIKLIGIPDNDATDNYATQKVPLKAPSSVVLNHGPSKRNRTSESKIEPKENSSDKFKNKITEDLLDENVNNDEMATVVHNGQNAKSDKDFKPQHQSNLKFLMGIFPDADHGYLETNSRLNKTDLARFISENLESNNYPKVTDIAKEVKKDEEEVDIGLYTTNFYIENFLKIFPDPFKYFLDENRTCQSSQHGFEFLKRRYRCHSVKLISRKYQECKYNLVKTCQFLDSEQPTRVTKRGLHELNMPEQTNLPFLQEACFIEHKDQIKRYIEGIAEAKQQAYDQAKERKELIECGCCYTEVLFEDCATCNEGDLFCKTCIQKGVEVRIGEGHTTFPCLLDCGSSFSLQLLKDLLDATMFSRLLQRIQLDEVKSADIEGLEICPFCEFAIILPPETNVFKCFNPECLKESCRKCHKLSHIPQRCEEVESDDQARARKYIEDEMTKALVRECYKCKKSFIKLEGCNKMTCTCGAKMCYICREPITDYKHFNGPGGSEKNKCPLYSTEKVLHVDAVEAVAKKALQEVASKNPELKLKHDPSKILPPTETSKTTLPPGVVEHAQGLIVRLQQHIERAQNQMRVQEQRLIGAMARLDNPNPAPNNPQQFPLGDMAPVALYGPPLPHGAMALAPPPNLPRDRITITPQPVDLRRATVIIPPPMFNNFDHQQQPHNVLHPHRNRNRAPPRNPQGNQQN